MKKINVRKNQIIAKPFFYKDNKTEMALLSINGNLRNEIIKNFNNHFLVEGDHIKNGGISSPKTMLSLIGAGFGSVGFAGLASGSLFMATANPATLMQIGNGVGSAVMAAGKIAAQAPFLPVSGALMPVAAPLVAFQVLSTITIMKQFEDVNKKLDKIQNTLNKILLRDEATFMGEIISASKIIADIEKQFSICNQFTDDMIIRLSLLENKVNPIFERYNFLYGNENITKNLSFEDLHLKENDAYMALVASILDIKIDLLKIKLNIQNNPGFIKFAAEDFVEKIDFYKEVWTNIQNVPLQLTDVASELMEINSKMNWWQETMPGWLFGKRKERKENEKKASLFLKVENEHKNQFDKTIENANKAGEEIKKSLLEAKKTSLVYWQDELGEHSYYTDDLLVE